jgi:hypothetical protein
MNVFWWHLLLSFVAGGVWLMAVSVIAERFGSKWGGIIGGLPSTVLIALFFIGINQGTHFAAAAAVVTPPAFIVNCFFLLIWATLIHRGYFKSLAIAGTFWLIATGLVVIIDSRSVLVNLIIWLVGLICLAPIVQKVLPVKDHGLLKIRFGFNQLLIRTIFAGSIIALAVLISKYSGSLIGGIFSAFPAVFISSFTILYIAEGPDFVQSFSRPLIISSGINTVLYTTAVYYAYPRTGIYAGTLVAFLITLFSAFCVVPIILSRINKQQS